MNPDQRAGGWLAGEHDDPGLAADPELAELRAIAQRIQRSGAEPDISPPVAPPDLRERVLRAVDEAAATAATVAVASRRRPGPLAVALLAAAAVIAAVVVAVGVLGGGDEPELVAFAVANERDGSVPSGRFAVSSRSWGTEVVLEVGGLEEGVTYDVWLSPPDGERVHIGGFTGEPGERLTLASSLPRDAAGRIWITDDEGVVLDSLLPSP